MEGIGKLIELLNEFEDYNKNCEWGKQYNYYSYRKRYEGDFERDLTENCMNIVFIISKTFGFIKWLVENNKIELHELSKKELATGWNLENNILDEENTKESWIKFWTENLLMLLAISDSPIDDLISYLR